MSRIGGALGGDLKDQRADIPPLDVVNAAMAPERYHFAPKCTRNTPARPDPGEMFSGKRLDQVIHSIGHFAPALFELLARWIATFKAFGKYALSRSPRMMEGKFAVWTNRVLAQPAICRHALGRAR